MSRLNNSPGLFASLTTAGLLFSLLVKLKLQRGSAPDPVSCSVFTFASLMASLRSVVLSRLQSVRSSHSIVSLSFASLRGFQYILQFIGIFLHITCFTCIILEFTIKILEKGKQSQKLALKGLNLCFNIMNVKLCLLNQEIGLYWSNSTHNY